VVPKPSGVTPTNGLSPGIEPGKLYTAEQVAKRIELSVRYVRRLIRAGEIEAIPFGRYKRVTAHELSRLMQPIVELARLRKELGLDRQRKPFVTPPMIELPEVEEELKVVESRHGIT
jgi:excisionase family DNA binding protein